MNLSFTILTFFLCFFILYAEDYGDWVDMDNMPFSGTTPGFYAGYLKIDNSKQFFYVFHFSESNPSIDPLIVRVSPGPGCSSLYSWLYSKGPFIFTPGTDSFRNNKHNWNKAANVLFIYGPAGVGFSTHSNYTSDNSSDEEFTLEMIQALFSFYGKFPYHKDKDLYLSGEQYAGIIIPRMAQWIVEKNNARETPAYEKIKLKGFILENPCTLEDYCNHYSDFTHYSIYYLKNHYFISRYQYSYYLLKCTASKQSEYCQEVSGEIKSGFSVTGSDFTNIYRECIKQIDPEQKYKCIDTLGILAFTKNYTVKKGLHVDSTKTWDLCNLNVLKNFKRGNGSLHVYEQLLREGNLRIWIVSGTLSAEVPTVGTKRWVESLKQSLQRNTVRIWDAWKFDGDINAGEIEEIRGMTFLTVRAAGSYIYRDQPEIGYHIITSFIKGKAL